MSPGLLRGLFDLSRARQAALSVAQPGLGALIALGMLPPTRTVVLGLVAAAAGYFAVFSLNDVLDLRSDSTAIKVGKAEWEGYDLDTAFERHPVAAGTLKLRVAIVWVVGLSAIAAVLAWQLSPWCVALFGASAALEAGYCALRKRTWAKTFVSGAMVGIGGLAGWVAVAPLDARAGVFFAFLAAWEIAGRNLPNDLSDIAADAAVGLHTVATTFGAITSSRAILAGALCTTFLTLAMPIEPLSVAGSAISSVAVMAAPAVVLLRRPTPREAGRYFNRASLLPAIVFLIVLADVLVMGSAR